MADPLNVLAFDDVKGASKLDVVPLIALESAITEKLAELEAKTGNAVDANRDAPHKSDVEQRIQDIEVKLLVLSDRTEAMLNTKRSANFSLTVGLVFTLSIAAAVLSLVALRGTLFGFGLFFGGCLLAYESVLVVRAAFRTNKEDGKPY